MNAKVPMPRGVGTFFQSAVSSQQMASTVLGHLNVLKEECPDFPEFPILQTCQTSQHLILQHNNHPS